MAGAGSCVACLPLWRSAAAGVQHGCTAGALGGQGRRRRQCSVAAAWTRYTRYRHVPAVPAVARGTWRPARDVARGDLARGDLGTLTARQRLGVPWGAGDVVAQVVREGIGASALQCLQEQGPPAGSINEMG